MTVRTSSVSFSWFNYLASLGLYKGFPCVFRLWFKYSSTIFLVALFQAGLYILNIEEVDFAQEDTDKVMSASKQT